VFTIKITCDNIEKKENKMFNNLFGTKAGKAKIDSQTAQVLELETQKKRLEIERDQIQIELANAKDRAVMQLEKETLGQDMSGET
jgi:outer membrane murein-binding lipoprotein Lpp